MPDPTPYSVPQTADDLPIVSSDLRALMQQYHDAINAQVEGTLADLEQRWAPVRATMDLEIQRLTQQMEQALANGDTLTAGWLAEAQRLTALKSLVEGNVAQFAAAAQADIGAAQLAAIQQGGAAAQATLQASVPPGVNYTFGVPPASVTAQFAGALQDGSPLAALFSTFGPEAADRAGQALFTSIALGENPRVAAERLQWATDLPRQRAEVIARTEILRSWRSAQLANYRANADVVQGWEWSCDFSPRSCFPAGTRIQTKRGLIPIEQVRVGDEALTHRGRYRPVLETLRRAYGGSLRTLETADGRRVTATSDHPFLAEWQGQLNWVEAADLGLGARVISQIERGAQIADHALGQWAIERRIRQTHDSVAQPLQTQRLTRILRSGFWRSVPVDAIDLENGVVVGQVEVGRIAPAGHGVFLDEGDAHLLETLARSGFGLRLARIATIALRRAKARRHGLRRRHAPLFTTGQAGRRLWWAIARLRAVVAAWIAPIDDAAALTGARTVLGVPVVAFARAVEALARVTRVGVKHLAAHNARHLHMARRLVAGIGAVDALRLARRSMELLAAVDADAQLAGLGFHASAGMGMLPLMSGVAGARAETPVATARPGIRDGKGFVTFDANLFHTTIVTQSVTHIQSSMTVYNLEVADDHSYVAEGFVVHNCSACIALDGTIHPLDEELDDHICGRCSALPLTGSWASILQDAGVSEADIPASLRAADAQASADARGMGRPTASEWLAQQPPEIQNQIMGPAKAEAWRQGAFNLSDLVGVRHDPQWGSSIQELSLKQMGLDAQDWLAKARAAGNGSVVADAETQAAAEASATEMKTGVTTQPLGTQDTTALSESPVWQEIANTLTETPYQGPTADYAQQVAENLAPNIAQYAALHPEMTLEEYKTAVAARLQEMVSAEGNVAAVRVPQEVLGSILDDGRLRSSHEVSNKGIFDAAGNNIYNTARVKFEEQAFGYTADAAVEQRPISGYLTDSGADNTFAMSYGDARLILSDAARQRATLTFGDSLDYGEGRPSMTPRPISDLAWDAYHYPASANPADEWGADNLAAYQENLSAHDPLSWQTISDYSHADGQFSDSYLEMQFHGGVSAKDIQEIQFNGRTPPSDALTKRLDELGIAWSYDPTSNPWK